MIEEAAALGPAVDRVLYDPGGSGAQAHQSFRRLYRKAVRQSYAVSFGKNKRKNVEFIRTLVRRTAEQADLPPGERYGVIGVCPEGAALLLAQMKEAKLGKTGGIEKAEDQHALDSLIAVVNLVRKQWENAHRDLG